MKTTINKIIGLFSLGLFLFAARDLCAQELQNEAHETLHQSAWDFMKKNTKDGGAQFRADYGETEGIVGDIVNCGYVKCNLNYQVCLERRNKAGTIAKDWLIKRLFNSPMPTDLKEYVCVDPEEVESYKEDGYTESEGFSNRQSRWRGLSTNNCYEAKVAGTAQAKFYCIKAIDGKVEVRAGENNKKTCEVVEVSWYNSRECFFCPLIGVVYAVADKITIMANAAFAKSFSIVMVVGLAVWIAFRTLTFVSSMSKQDAAKYITELLVQSFKFLMAFFALAYYDQVFEYIILPLIQAGMAFGTEFIQVQTLYERFGEEFIEALKTASQDKDSSVLISLGDKVPSDYIRNADNIFFNVYTYATIENLAHNINLEYSLLQTIGSSLICVGFKLMFFIFEAEEGGFGLGVASIVYGFFFGLFGLLFTVAFVFYLIDVVVQLGFVGVLLPFFIASWPFKKTSKYTSTGFELLLNSIFVFMSMGIIVNLSMKLISAAVAANTEVAEGESAIENGLSSLIRALTEIDTTTLSAMVNVISIGFILFLMANIMSLLLIQKAQEFADQFASGGLPSITSEAAGRAGAKIKETGKKIASATTATFGAGFKQGVKDVIRKDKNKGGNP